MKPSSPFSITQIKRPYDDIPSPPSFDISLTRSSTTTPGHQKRVRFLIQDDAGTERRNFESSSIYSPTGQSSIQYDQDYSQNIFSHRQGVSASGSYIDESGNDGTWLTLYGFRTPQEIQFILDEFTRFGVIEKHVIVEESNYLHVKYETRLQAQKALTKHGHLFGKIMIGVRLCQDKDIIGLKPTTNPNIYLENPFLIRHRRNIPKLNQDFISASPSLTFQRNNLATSSQILAPLNFNGAFPFGTSNPITTSLSSSSLFNPFGKTT